MLEGIDKRFNHLFSDRRFILDSLTIPQFKTAWIEDEGPLNNVVSILKEEIKVLAKCEFDNKQSNINDSEKSSEDGFSHPLSS